MLTLKNIKKTNKYIEANYSPEDSEELAFIKINCQDGNIVEAKKTAYEGDSKTYMAHAKFKLLDLAKSGEIVPNEYKVVWY